ncbi:FecR family protein [Pseudomonas sp.]|uniref:FecR family protein n=1 Tax=Pseudomonas sp. TaxID=306 RepID=UPI00262F8A78|nr:FecR family protein [Pseudomonas sp.]
MDTRECSCGSATVREAAAAWFARVQDQPLNEAEQAEFDAWRARHASHEAEYQWLAGLWSAADLLPEARLQALCEVPMPRLSRRSLVGFGLAAGVLAVAVGAGVWTQLQPSLQFSEAYATAPGERRTVTLPDGSVIELNSHTRLQVHFENQQRAVDLEQGQAMFSVTRDPARPFVVQAGPGRVTVTGTRFDVRHDSEEARVVVESGTVRVQGTDPLEAVELITGLGTRVNAQGRVAAAQPVNVSALMAWRNGQLVFDNASLSEVAEEVSRYREQPLVVNATAVAQLRLSSVFKTDDTDALIQALPRILPVAIQTRADGSQEIISR